jgi:phosphoribosyl-ATP pyrophosphohydrolase
MLNRLFAVIEARKAAMPEGSYTASLFQAGQDAILRKIGEEALEVILAAKEEGEKRLVEEVADLFYHTLVLLSLRGLTLESVEEELRHRRQPEDERDR